MIKRLSIIWLLLTIGLLAQETANLDSVSFTLTDQALENLKSEGVPDSVTNLLESLVNVEFKNKEKFLAFAKTTIGEEQLAKYQSQILRQAEEPFIKLIEGPKEVIISEGHKFWILGHKEYKNFIKISRYYEIDSERIDLLNQKIVLLDSITTEKDSVIALYREGYVHYRDLWTDTSFKLEEAEVKASKRWQFFQVGFLVGAVATVGLAVFVRSL